MGFAPENAVLTPWSEAEAGLVAAKTYWLATTRSDGRPHVMPVWGVWLDNKFFFSTSTTSRKGKNLAQNPHCTISVSRHAIDIVVEGKAAFVRDDALAQRVADLYSPKYEWPVTVRDSGIYGENGDGGPLYVLTPTVAFGFGAAENFTATRWRF
jgi:nitroimidazol reductase NimA-like FMN-containing flavoprotein (pyridoxamine 5'-phosphate oxidase superfamily)